MIIALNETTFPKIRMLATKLGRTHNLEHVTEEACFSPILNSSPILQYTRVSWQIPQRSTDLERHSPDSRDESSRESTSRPAWRRVADDRASVAERSAWGWWAASFVLVSGACRLPRGPPASGARPACRPEGSPGKTWAWGTRSTRTSAPGRTSRSRCTATCPRTGCSPARSSRTRACVTFVEGSTSWSACSRRWKWWQPARRSTRASPRHPAREATSSPRIGPRFSSRDAVVRDVSAAVPGRCGCGRRYAPWTDTRSYSGPKYSPPTVTSGSAGASARRRDCVSVAFSVALAGTTSIITRTHTHTHTLSFFLSFTFSIYFAKKKKWIWEECWRKVYFIYIRE